MANNVVDNKKNVSDRFHLGLMPDYGDKHLNRQYHNLSDRQVWMWCCWWESQASDVGFQKQQQ